MFKQFKVIFLFGFVLAFILMPAALAQQPATTEEPAVATTPLIPLLAQPTQGTSAQPSLPGGQTAQPTLATTPSSSNTTPTTAQANSTASEGASCPTLVQDGFNTTPIICDPLNPGEACVGNGVVEAAPRSESPDFSFARPGDKISFTELSELQLRTLDTDSRAWTIVKASLALNTTDDSPPAEATLVIFGDVTIADAGEQASSGARSGVVLATNGMNVRSEPTETGTPIWQLAPNETITITGKTVDNNWLRMEIPSRFGGIGWVYAPFIDVEGGAETLPIVTVNSPRPSFEAPEYGAMQAFRLLSAVTDESCVGTPDSGVLLQSPSGVAASIKLRVNDVEIFVNGTIFIQAQASANLLVSVLEGEASINANDTTATARAGEQASVAMGPNLEPSSAPTTAPFDTATLQTLPFSLLPRPFVLGDSIVGTFPQNTGAAIPQGSGEPADAFSLQPAAAPTQTLTCILTSRDGATKNIRQIPSINAGISGYLQPGQNIQATTIGRDADGYSYRWYQTAQGWLREDTVTASEGCASISGSSSPVAFIPTPTLVPLASATPGGAAPAATGPSVVVVGLPNLTELCTGSNSYSTSMTVTSEELSFPLGTSWTASPGTVLTIGISDGAIFRGEYGDFIRLVDSAGTTLIGSGQQRAIRFTFTQPTTFTVNLSSSKGTFIIISLNCAAA